MNADLVIGQNRLVSGTRVAFEGSGLPQGFGLAAIPLGPSPAAPWHSGSPNPGYLADLGDGHCRIDLDALGPGTDSVLLAAYAVRGVRTFSAAAGARFSVDGSAVALAAEAGHLTAVVFARLYRHGGGWKLRALSEGTMRGLADLGRRHGIPIDESDEPGPPPRVPSPYDGTPVGVPSWTGTGFIVAPGLMLTNAHVVEGASTLVAAGFDGRTHAEPVIVDASCDLALLRLQAGVAGPPLPFRAGHGPSLGEMAIALGYPLAGFLGSGPQVAHGSVSGLLGPSEDARILQITTPIQGGSSGGPVLDTRGRVIGVVTASLQGAQNVNFAVRGSLAQALVEAAGRIADLAGDDRPETDVAGVARMARGAVWRLEARR